MVSMVSQNAKHAKVSHYIIIRLKMGFTIIIMIIMITKNYRFIISASK